MSDSPQHAVFFDVSGTLLTPHPSQLFGVEICPDAHHILSLCRNRKLAGRSVVTGVITNWGARVHSLFTSLQLNDCFDFVIHAQTLGALKPKSEVFQYACQLAQLSPRQCVHVGDSLFHDAIGAQRAGLHGVWIERELATFHSFSERAMIASLKHEPIIHLTELEPICHEIFNEKRNHLIHE